MFNFNYLGVAFDTLIHLLLMYGAKKPGLPISLSKIAEKNPVTKEELDKILKSIRTTFGKVVQQGLIDKYDIRQ